MRKFKEFSALTVFKISKHKTKVLKKGRYRTKQIDEEDGFKIEKKGKYLGVNLINLNCMLFQNNCIKIWNEVKNICQNGKKKYNWSLLGQISKIKIMFYLECYFCFRQYLF